jgi:hypothetical protein
MHRVRIAWALIKLAHDLCFIYATVEDLFATCDMGTCDVTVKSVHKMVDSERTVACAMLLPLRRTM